MSDIGIAGGRIRSFVERIEHIEAEIAELNEGKKEIFAKAKGEGFNIKVIEEVIKLRKQDQDERDEQGTLLDLYMKAMDSASVVEEAQAARSESAELTAFQCRISGDTRNSKR